MSTVAPPSISHELRSQRFLEKAVLYPFPSIKSSAPKEYIWPSFLAASNLYQAGMNFQSCHGLPLENPNRRACAEIKLPDSLLWSDTTYSYPVTNSLAGCPRSYQSEQFTDSASGSLDSISEAYPPAAYHLDPQQYSLFADDQQQESGESTSPMELESQALAQLHLDRFDNDINGGLFRPDQNHQGSAPADSVIMPDDYSPDLMPTVEDDDETDGTTNEEPYAKLIYKALMSVPEHKMVLRDIYGWFQRNTDKAKNSSSKGWQNSIRHNLSMNGAFQKVDQVFPADESKKGFIWVLEPSAVLNGVKSTTRFRKSVPFKKTARIDSPAPQRQRSGAKGGRAARKAARSRRAGRVEDSDEMELIDRAAGGMAIVPRSSIENHSHGPPLTPGINSHITRQPSYGLDSHSPYSRPKPVKRESYSFGFEDIVGCIPNVPGEPFFCDDSDILEGVQGSGATAYPFDESASGSFFHS
ncbi:MAG: hypothetical protein M1819_006588 [Sarea resinae]|nr:MAG: hypothetical protein M1819_006588 [Sarea resinae]